MNILSINVNFSVIGRALKRNFITIFMMSIILGCLSFVAIDYVVPQKYTTTVNLSVIAEGNVANNLSSRKLAAAVTRYVNVLDKDVMSKKICEDLKTDELPGKIEVSSIYGSNLVVVKCISNSPRTSFEMSQLFRKYYQRVASQLSGNYRITDLGVSNVNLISTSKSVSVIMAILIGLIVFVVECGWVILMKIFDGKVQDEKQAEREIDTSFIGTIMHENKNKKRNQLLITHKNVSSVYIESMKKISAKVIYTVAKKDYKTILVTSTLEGEGKSTISANLALAMAQQGKKVLLIDADLRRRVQYKVFGKEDFADLGDYLDGKIDLDEVIEQDEENNLYYAFPKTPRENADELLENGKMQNLLEQMEKVMDYIIIDTAPSGITRDAQVLSGFVDAALIVVKQEKAKIVVINDMIDELEQEKMEVMGFVLNNVWSKQFSVNRYNNYYTKSREFADS